MDSVRRWERMKNTRPVSILKFKTQNAKCKMQKKKTLKNKIIKSIKTHDHKRHECTTLSLSELVRSTTLKNED